jgi:ATP synthase in type III secretion protein N
MSTVSQLPRRDPLIDALARATTVRHIGRVAEAYGTLIRATGVQASIGEVCELRSPNGGATLLAEVVGVSKNHTLLTPLGALDGISAATEVVAIGQRATVAVGAGMLGRILDPLGAPIDGRGELRTDTEVPIYRDSPNPLSRSAIDRPLPSGVRAIDAALTVGAGQRVGIFAVAGGGKSTLLGMLARGAAADVNVIALVGERGREVNEFIHDNLGAEGLAKSVVVVATSDRPALERARAAYVATAIAEHFRDQGKNVVLMMDSVTRFARALRDVGLAVGEPPARRGYPPSVFSALPRLFERAGNDANGSITAFYTVLMEEEDGSDPIAEEVRSILDGHVILSRKLAAAYHYPAIDLLASASRVMPRIVDENHQRRAGLLRKTVAKFQDMELLLQMGEYKPGADAEADFAVQNIGAVRSLLQQPSQALSRFDDAERGLTELFG